MEAPPKRNSKKNLSQLEENRFSGSTSLLNLVPALIAYVDKDLCYRYVNHSYEKWMGRGASEIVGKTVGEVQGKEVLKKVQPFINTVLSGEAVHFENEVYNKDGRRCLEVFFTPDFDHDQRVKGYCVLIHDITEKKETEKELHKKKNELEDYIENATIGLHWVNEKGIIIWANRAELEMLGYTKGEYIGHHISEFHADQNRIQDILEKLSCNQTLNQYEAKLKCKDGSIRDVVINSNVYRENGKFVHTRCFTLDVTEKKQAEKKLLESQAHYMQLLKCLPVGVYTCDADGYVELFNDAAVALWGRKPVPGKDLWCGSWRMYHIDGVHIPHEECPMAVALKEGCEVFGQELIVEREDGKRSIVTPYPQPIFNEKGNVVGAVNVVIDITERKQAEQLIKESKTRYEQLIRGLPVAVYTCNAEGKVTLYNDTAVKLWGREPEIGKDLWCGSWKIYNPEDGSPMPLDTCPMAIALKEGRAVVGEEIIVERPDGVKRYVTPNPQPIFNESGKITGAINTLIDITEQKLIEQAIRESEERFRSMADQAPIAVWMCDVKGDCIYLNSKWSELTGKLPYDGYGTHWMDLIHPDDQEVTAVEWRKTFEQRAAFDMKFRYENAEEDYLIVRSTANPRYMDSGEFVGYIGIMHDVTLQENTRAVLEIEVNEKTKKLQKRNEELRRSEERYHLMVEEVQDYAIILLDHQGVIQNWNKGAEKIKGYRPEEAVGKNFCMFYTMEDQKSGLPEKLIEEARIRGRANYEGWRLRKDGSIFWGHVVITALHNDKKEVIGFSKVTRDLTARKLAEDKLKLYTIQLEEQNKKLEAVNVELASFAYVSSHDLQEPLRKIRTFTSRILDTEQNLTEKGKDYFNRIEAAATRMQDLIEGLLSYSQADTPDDSRQSVKLDAILEEVKNELKEKIEEKNTTIHSYPLPTLKVIPFQFHQLFANLLSNAIKFSRNDVPPHIEIKSDITKGTKIDHPSANLDLYYHHISISDNGIGFDPQYNLKIFDVFKRLHNRSKYSGTGIGLSICKKIVENHQGIITAEGKEGEGAIFHIYIPLDQKE